MRTIEYHSEVGVEFLEGFDISIHDFIAMTTADPSWHFNSEIQTLILAGHKPEHSVELNASGDHWDLVSRFHISDEEFIWFVLQYPNNNIH